MRRKHCLLSILFMAAVLWGLHAPGQAAERPQPAGSHGTAVHLGKAWEAAHKATQENKLLLLVHISGMFEDPTFT